MATITVSDLPFDLDAWPFGTFVCVAVSVHEVGMCTSRIQESNRISPRSVLQNHFYILTGRRNNSLAAEQCQDIKNANSNKCIIIIITYACLSR